MFDREFVEPEGCMARVKVSGKYQIVIPREVREALHIHKGQTVSVIPVGGVIEVVPDQELATLEGAFPGIPLTDVRDESDRDERRPA
jgi:AbrB family looped-hinge helix DNA binding protein